MSNLPSFERFSRITPPQELMQNPEALFDYCEKMSIASLDLAHHYDGKNVSMVLPLHGEGEFYKNSPVLKLCMAGSFKPTRELSDDEPYLRVCAEQNGYDNTLKLGDLLLGFQMNRISRKPEPIEGNGESNEFCLCIACRKRALRIVGPDFVVVSYVGSETDDVEASTVQQQIDHFDKKMPREYLARGRQDVKEYIIEKVLKNKQRRKLVERLPLVPSRIYRRTLV